MKANECQRCKGDGWIDEYIRGKIQQIDCPDCCGEGLKLPQKINRYANQDIDREQARMMEETRIEKGW